LPLISRIAPIISILRPELGESALILQGRYHCPKWHDSVKSGSLYQHFSLSTLEARNLPAPPRRGIEWATNPKFRLNYNFHNFYI
jgi:hypothetical protein